MLNILVLSEQAKELHASFNSDNFALHTEALKRGESADKLLISKYDIAFLDLDMPGWQQKLLDLRQRMRVIAFSTPSTKLAVEAMKLGAADYLEKPLSVHAFNEAVLKFKKKALEHKYGFDEIMGTSPSMQDVFNKIKKAAIGESNVLITGESGTGKELVARAIHRWSPRSEKPFVPINCSAIPDNLLESELFGFEKGAFTGAVQSKKGILELADGGTIFFDEIGNVSPLFQTKILRVLQEGEIRRIGGSGNILIDIRFIAATNRDLRAAVAKNTFREDLFYRLNVINIHLPPLRERKEDIPLLVKHFTRKHAPKRRDLLIKGVAPETIDLLIRYSFPGNIRELENIVESAVSLANSSEIMPEDLPSFMRSSAKEKRKTRGLKDTLKTIERETILAALNEAGWNISRAAAILEIYRQQLQKKIKTLGLTPPP